MTHCCQEAIVQAMLMPDFYPHAAASITYRETHISHVFLTGRFAYKIKKPVNFGFLDFSTLEKRHKYCLAEVKLNRRLTNGIYLDVVRISAGDQGFYLGGGGKPVEYAVQMVQLSDACVMSHLLQQSGVQSEDVAALAHVLAAFYRKALIKDRADPARLLKTVWINCEDNFNLLRQFSGSLFDDRKFRMIESACRSFFDEKRLLFEQRIKQGWFRDCHGDLRSEHIYFSDNGIQIIDCIEFNHRLRQLDVLCDLAFLIMDLDYRGCSDLGLQLLRNYADLTGDDDTAVFMKFYKCYRAIVRLKVSCLRFRELDPDGREGRSIRQDIEQYLNLAQRYAAAILQPRLWVVCGVPASGKSAIARGLSKKLGIKVFHSDAVRKTMFRHAAGGIQAVGFEEGIYSKQATTLTYDRLFQSARKTLEKGRSAILDATFSARSRRMTARKLAEDTSASIRFVECQAPDELIRDRLVGREKTASMSDARIFHFESFKRRFEPMDEIDLKNHIRVDTSRPVKECLRDVMARAIED